ncbi:hypothetical protein GCM10027046_23770 [Uliginosibacterium flavum]|uniref:Uncharacterized protein n=1 Tax=Uliginosibacterium flavum TaxID=1396831 RepID=A0ABV2TMB6_9RHOO
MPLKYDTSHIIMLKSAIEQLLGREAWYELKETTSLSPWRKNVLKLLKAIRISVEESVEVRDQAWFDSVAQNIARGEECAKASKDIDELLSCFTATLLRQVFLQIGTLPNRIGQSSVSLRRDNWKLNGHRSVQYVQSSAQIESVFWSLQQKQIGIDNQMALLREHRKSKSTLSYSEWFRQREAL